MLELSEGVFLDFNVVIGLMFGSGFFIVIVVFGVVIWVLLNVVVINKDAFGAFMGLFVVANIVLLLVMCFGMFKMWYIMMFFVFYVMYFCFIVFCDILIYDA